MPQYAHVYNNNLAVAVMIIYSNNNGGVTFNTDMMDKRHHDIPEMIVLSANSKFK